MGDVEEKEGLEDEKAAREQQAQQKTEELKAANLQVVETIFSDLFEDDEDNKNLKTLPGIQEKVSAFAGEIEKVSKEFLEAGLEKDKLKKDEKSSFEKALGDTRMHYVSESIKMC